ncbi:GNAT family N-acetyltransferase [Vibrio cidicii]|uniref:GNAT family N-acetyltransferase n=1 Tax=Vibrio cidicii TaxID=1763883 RepID=UPI0039B6EC5A
MKNQWLNCQGVASTNFVKFTDQLSSQLAIKTELKEWSCFGFHVDQVLVGVVEAKQVGSELQLSSLAVAPSFRQKGVARKLVDFVVTQFTPINSVSVWCVEQTGNVAVFKALGLKVVQRFDSDFFILSDGSKSVEVQLKQKVTA